MCQSKNDLGHLYSEFNFNIQVKGYTLFKGPKEETDQDGIKSVTVLYKSDYHPESMILYNFKFKKSGNCNWIQIMYISQTNSQQIISFFTDTFNKDQTLTRKLHDEIPYWITKKDNQDRFVIAEYAETKLDYIHPAVLITYQLIDADPYQK